VPARTNKSTLDLVKIYGPALLLTLIAFLVAYQFVDPAPPDSLVIAAGSEEGAYTGFARRYGEILERQGIRLEIRSTKGSLENLQLLSSGEVDLAFVQGGTEQAASALLYSLGSLYFEPAWLFHRSDRSPQRLPDLKGARLAVGTPGSGTRALALALLADNALEPGVVVPVELGGREAADALLAGEVDAAFFVSGADSPLVRELIRAPQVRLMSFRRAAAYTRLHAYLSELLLPEGMIDMPANIPDRDVYLLAPAANLVAKEGVHPALLDQVLQAAQKVHGEGGWFEAEGRFPAADLLVFPLSPEAKRFYEHGPPLLQRYLPFWAATLVDRLKVMLVPLVVILIPLLKVMPPIYTWRMRAKIYRWYKALERLEERTDQGLDEPARRRALEELELIDDEVRKVHVPLSFAAQSYDLRLHIQLVRESLLSGREG